MTCSFHKYGDFFPGTGDLKVLYWPHPQHKFMLRTSVPVEDVIMLLMWDFF
jgi:hypothetical protein